MVVKILNMVCRVGDGNDMFLRNIGNSRKTTIDKLKYKLFSSYFVCIETEVGYRN
jgi:hypothetical protein